VSALYFISDVHLGLEPPADEAAKEARLLDLLDDIAADAERLYIIGDLFDFWFEYRHAVPVHGLRVLARLQTMVEAGTEVHYLAGNHDFALGPFISEEVGCVVHPGPFAFGHDDRRFYLHHGDGLAGRDLGYRILKRVLRSGVSQSLWRLVHPDLGFAAARAVSRASRGHTAEKDYGPGDRMEAALQRLAADGHDVVLMGHTHTPEVRDLAGGTRYVNLGSWLQGGRPWARYAEGTLEVTAPDGSVSVLPVPRRGT
jgi:UDP-2,3-diacylglucosamine hydrolase